MFKQLNFTWIKAVLLVAVTLSPRAMAASRPNVIVIMADDIGAEGLGCYGSEIYTTPNLDRMAQEGVRFKNAYATPLCTPTRVMVMSGLYPNRTGFRTLIGKGEGVRMPASIKTIGHYFRDADYHTAIAGKWQLGKFDENPGQPIEHGFDEYCMWTWIYQGKKSSRYYGPQIYRDGKVTNGDKEDFGPDHYSEFVLDFIDRNNDKPFFVYYPMALVHSPFIHPPELEELARSKYTDDLDKSTIAQGHMITYMDHIVGRILERLKQHGIAQNTLVIFTGDNGTHRKITSKLAGIDLKGGKGTMTEAGSRVPLLAWWPESIQPAVQDEFFCLVDVLPTIASVSGIELDAPVDGLDLSHNLYGRTGRNREHVLINYGKGYFVRDKRFRLNQDGKFYDIPVTSDVERYSEKQCDDPTSANDRKRLQVILDQFMAIKPEHKSTTWNGSAASENRIMKAKKKQPKTNTRSQ